MEKRTFSTFENNRGRATLTQHEISRLGVNLNPFKTFVLEPLHAGVLEEVDLIRPPELSLLIPEKVVVFFTDFVSSFESHQTAIFLAIWQKIDEALDAA